MVHHPHPRYYSTVVAGVITLITLNNYIPFHEGTPQHNWAMEAFAKVDRTQTPWLFVQFHAPPYHTYLTHYKEMVSHKRGKKCVRGVGKIADVLERHNVGESVFGRELKWEGSCGFGRDQR